MAENGRLLPKWQTQNGRGASTPVSSNLVPSTPRSVSDWAINSNFRRNSCLVCAYSRQRCSNVQAAMFRAGRTSHPHTVDFDLFITSQLSSTQSTLGPCVVESWARKTSRVLRETETDKHSVCVCESPSLILDPLSDSPRAY